jgi:hypothetical protein
MEIVHRLYYLSQEKEAGSISSEEEFIEFVAKSALREDGRRLAVNYDANYGLMVKSPIKFDAAWKNAEKFD